MHENVRLPCSPVTAVAAILSCVLLAVPLPKAWAQIGNEVMLHGSVVDASGHALTGAFVGADGTTVRTDRTGRYELQVPAASQILVFAWAPGYRRMSVYFSAPDGGMMTGDITADFTGSFALTSAFQNPAYGASLRGLPVKIGRRVHSVKLDGTAAVPLEPRLAVILPNGSVKTYPLHARGRRFSATLPFSSKGTYYVEVNATSGFAVFNVLVFHGVAPTPPLQPYFPPEPTHVTSDQLEQYALYIINHARETLGCPALTMQPQLLAAARSHNADMLRNNYFLSHPHIGSDGSSPRQRIERSGLRAHAWGEVVGEGDTIATTIVGFLDSAEHRSVLSGHYRWAGVAVSQIGGGVLLTVDLAR